MNGGEMVAALDGTPEQDHAAPWIRIDPERDRVRVSCGGALDRVVARQLREDCGGLIDRGFDRVILDLSETTALAPAAVSAIAAINRRARALGCRFSVVPGTGSAAATLRRTGLIEQLMLEDAHEVFLDWSR
jgi:anti-anti-sigma regulatory factor